jgi:Trk K+ transport system NAD-binding subunit/Kef-type K+ transport system membrane component KefB/predicted transcriptional regulator
MDPYRDICIFLACFVVISLASNQFGRFFIKARLPLISGFLFTGIIAGPSVLGMIPEGALEHLRFVDETSLAFIAFAAGSELYLKELTSRLKSIAWVTTGLLVSTFTLGSLTIFLMAQYIPFMQDMPTLHRVAVSVLGGAVLVARSPASAIAVIRELRATGPFTQTALGVTVIMDGVVIALFAVCSSVADALLTNVGFDLSFLLLLLIELSASLAVAFTVGKFLQLVLSCRIRRLVKTAAILATGYGVFILSSAIREFSHDQFHVEVLLEPLLICMLASILVTNYSKYRTEFLAILHDAGPPIYIFFFTLTGASLALDVLAKTWVIAVVLFIVRLGAIFIGSFSGGTLAGDPLRQNRIGWMCYVTQAGVALGLAKEAAVEFPVWGTDFATIIISVVVLNQIVGPPLFKFAIAMAGEAHSRLKSPQFEGTRSALIFGFNEQSLALARQLRLHDWQVKIASTSDDPDEQQTASDLDIQQISDLTLSELQRVGAAGANTIVAMLNSEENYRLCELAYEHFGTDNLVVRLNDRANFDRFNELGALVVDSTTAMINLLDHSVRSPTAASLLLGMEENQDIVDLEVRNPALRGVLLRDLRLPLDTLVLSIHRGGQMLITHGDTRLRVGDRMTVVGSVESLEEVMVRFAEPSPSSRHGKRERDTSGLRVEHVMRRHIRAIAEDANFDQVVEAVSHSRDAHFAVVNAKGVFVGMISFEEIRDVLFDEGLKNIVNASDLAHECVPWLSPQDSLEHAISQFDECGYGSLPVIDAHDSRKLVGFLDQRSVLRMYHHKGRAGS